MGNMLYQTFKKKLDIPITTKQVKQIHALVVNFETRDKHPLTLNSQLLNVYPLVFTRYDTQSIYDIFGLDPDEVTAIQDEVVHVVNGREEKVVNRDFNVAGDTLNILITWLLHLIYNSKLSSRDNHNLMIDMLKLWHYKFLTSLLSNIPYRSNEDVMRATINRLTKQSDIIRHGTWAKVMEAQANKIVDKKSKHIGTIMRYNDDAKVFYFITDTQSRVRDKVKKIIGMFMATNQLGAKISTYSTTAEIDGANVVLSQINTFDSMISNLSIEILNADKFINDKAIDTILKIFTNVKSASVNIRSDMFRYLLNRYCELALTQSISGELDKVVELRGGSKRYVGTRVLISNIIQQSYRYLINKQIDTNNKLMIILTLKNIYSSSMISSKELNDIKNSVSYFVDTNSKSRRAATNSTLKIAFILYCILKTLRYN